MKKAGLVRMLSAAAVLGTARDALAQAAAEPSFHVTSGGWISLVGTAIFVFLLITLMRKMG